ncbi:hypothetical protein [Phycobacter azelaicus]|uniref:hypothetical protein n=1 Tax=Phycobacter azelaicus TaxID=2668075 RepID=UPI00186887B9|nr:hypothetical protein [Phycobacter azelaicus]
MGLITAILASNPHNTQPWQISIDDGSFVLHADTTRHLGAFDPYRREMWIGLGCAIANAEIAAPGFGFATEEPVIREGLNGFGTITLKIDKQAPKLHPLAASISKRRTNRGKYETKAISKDILSLVTTEMGEISGARVVFFDRDTKRGGSFAEATLRGTDAINADKEMSHDGHLWFRGTARKVARYRDGVSVPTAGLSPFISIMGQILPEADVETSGNYWFASTKRQLEYAGGFGLIMVDDLYSRSGQLAAGRLWQRIHLALTKHDLAAHPMNQLPELVDRDRHLGTNRGWRETLTAIAGEDGHATFAFRYGVPTADVPHSARRPLSWINAPL